jgi:putative tricarboxylic transport membrane protein
MSCPGHCLPAGAAVDVSRLSLIISRFLGFLRAAVFSAVLFALAAVGFGRRALHTGDDLMLWLATGSVLASVTKALGDAVTGSLNALRYPLVIIRSAAVGLGLGVIPGVGTPVATFVSYGITKRASKSPERFGKGAPEGIVASEAADNAVASGSLVPTLTLGVPGSAVAAIILAALFTHGIQPGPRLMTTNVAEVYALLIAMVIASLLILPFGIILAAPLTWVTRIPIPYLVPSILALCLVGTFTLRHSLFDVGLALVFGLLGVMLRVSGYPIVPLILAMILGPIAEENFLRTLALGRNSITYFFASPIALGLWSFVAALLAWNVFKAVRDRRRSKALEPSDASLDGQ